MESILGITRRPDIKFFRNGKIDISSNLSRQLSLSRGDTLDILRHQGEYYLVVRCRNHHAVGRNEATCFPTTKGKACHHFRAYSKKLCAAILSVCGSDKAYLPAGSPIQVPLYGTAIPLITRNNLTP